MYHIGVVIDLLLSDGLGDLLPVPLRLSAITSADTSGTCSSNNRTSNTPHHSPQPHYSFRDKLSVGVVRLRLWPPLCQPIRCSLWHFLV